jgi:hypothetical protein
MYLGVFASGSAEVWAISWTDGEAGRRRRRRGAFRGRRFSRRRSAARKHQDRQDDGQRQRGDFRNVVFHFIISFKVFLK